MKPLRFASTEPVRGILFDLDGTLVDSALDFEQMRREMELPAGQPILEAIDQLPPSQAARCREILHRHEWAGVERARAMPGVIEFLAALDQRAVRRAVVTRNGRAMAQATLDRLGLRFDLILAREDAPAKPDPAALLLACDQWRIDCARAAIIGDYRFDIEAGLRAGMRTVLYTQGRPPAGLPGAELAQFHLRCFTDCQPLLNWLGLA